MTSKEIDKIVKDAKDVIYKKYTYLSEIDNDLESRTVRASIEFSIEMLKNYDEILIAKLREHGVDI